MEVTLRPEKCRSLDTVLEVVSGDGDKTVICTTAIVHHPQVCVVIASIVRPVERGGVEGKLLRGPAVAQTPFEFGYLFGRAPKLGHRTDGCGV